MINLKKTLFFTVCIAFFIACSSNKTVPENAILSIKEEVNTVVNNWHNAASKANFNAYFNTMDNPSIFIGTDASENWTKEAFQKFCKPYFDKGKAWSFTPLERNIYTNSRKDVVWFDELLDTWMGTCRGSGVLEKQGDSWKIKHYVLSVAIPNEDIQKVIEVKYEKDSIFRSKF